MRGKEGKAHEVMWVKMDEDCGCDEVKGQEFAIEYPGNGRLSFLHLWYNTTFKGREGTERLRLATEAAEAEAERSSKAFADAEDEEEIISPAKAIKRSLVWDMAIKRSLVWDISFLYTGESSDGLLHV